jgi:hypothetical protein
MGYARLGFAVAFYLLIATSPASALGPQALTSLNTSDIAAAAGRLSVHFHKSQSFYCYPRNYWWFYRPYTTALDDHPRCMPYFHYLGPYGGSRAGRPIK